jgi:protein-S-isoprenylcysteine O-methyltransferase Ste14
MNVWIRSLLFTIFIPGTVAGLIPYLLVRNYIRDFDYVPVYYLGILFLVTGLLFYVFTVFVFIIKGKGTPAIWFTSKFKWLIGEEPGNLVSSGLYRLSRNPMYLGVIFIVFGEALLLQNYLLLFYSVLLFIIFHIIVIYVEEPHLKAKYGNDYIKYMENTRRWLF